MAAETATFLPEAISMTVIGIAAEDVTRAAPPGCRCCGAIDSVRVAGAAAVEVRFELPAKIKFREGGGGRWALTTALVFLAAASSSWRNC